MRRGPAGNRAASPQRGGRDAPESTPTLSPLDVSAVTQAGRLAFAHNEHVTMHGADRCIVVVPDVVLAEAAANGTPERPSWLVVYSSRTHPGRVGHVYRAPCSGSGRCAA